MSDEVILRVNRRDAGRILSGLRERQRKLKKGVTKFGDEFDPEKGKNMLEGLEAYNNLIQSVEGQINA
jgi:hypothetical protein